MTDELGADAPKVSVRVGIGIGVVEVVVPKVQEFISLQVDIVLGMLVADRWRTGADLGWKRERSADRQAT